MAQFKFAVRGQHLDLLTPTRGLSDEYIVYSCRVDFRESSWDGMDKWIHFVDPGDPENPILANLDENNEVTPDRDLQLTPGVWDVFIHGDLEEGGEIVKRIVTNSVGIKIENSGIIDGAVFPEFDQEIADQIEDAVNDANDAYIRGAKATVTDTTPTAENPQPMCSAGISSSPVVWSAAFAFNRLQGNTITGITPVTDGENRGKITFSLKSGASVVFNNLMSLIDNWTYYTFADAYGDGNIAIGIASV